MDHTPQAISNEFDDIMNTEDTAPRAPFYDDTMNFLNAQYTRASVEIDKLEQQQDKTAEKIEVRVQERDTARELLIKEWRERKPANPITGEIVLAPFGEE